MKRCALTPLKAFLLLLLAGLPSLCFVCGRSADVPALEVAPAAAPLQGEQISPLSDRDRATAASAKPEGGRSAAAGLDASAPDFNNGCSLPDWDRVRVPKTKEALEIQLGKGFTVVRRGIFLIASDLDEKRFDYVVNGVFACCRELLEREFFSKAPSKVVTVYIFANRESYVRSLREHFGMEPISPYGHYGHTKRYIVVNYATGPGTLVHEMTHALMAADFPRAPIWISEGLASLYEQCRVENNRLLGEQNWRLPELQKAVARSGLTPLTALLASDTGQFRAMRESLNYAQSRYFCLYLQEKNVLREVYTRFRDNAGKDPSGAQTLEAILGKPLAQIEADWLQWVARQQWDSGIAPSAAAEATAEHAQEESADDARN